MAQLLSPTPGTPRTSAARRPGGRRRRARGEDGASLALTMAVVAIVFSLGAVWLTFSTHSTSAAGYERRRQQAVDAANAGLVVAAAGLGKASTYTGSGASPVSFPGGSAQYEVTVGCEASGDTPPCDTLMRRVTATGYAPAKTTIGRSARTLQQTVELVPQLGGGSFPYVIMSSKGIKLGANAMVNGDIYAESGIELSANHGMVGNIIAQSSVKISSNFRLTGNIHARSDVTLEPNVDVIGSVTTQGNVTLKANVKVSDDVVATGNIDDWPKVCDKVDGDTCQRYTQVEPPAQQTFPQFQYNSSNFPGLVYYASGSAMVTALKNKSFSGTHFANSGPTFEHNDRWTLTGDTTILFNGNIKLPGNIVNGTSGNVQLTIISVSSGDIITNANTTIPSTVRTLVYGGKVISSANFTFTGVIYAFDMETSANVKIDYAPVVGVPGFNFGSGGTVTSYNIRNVSTREVPAT